MLVLGRAPWPMVPACPPCLARSPKPPAHRQLWVRGCGLVWWLSRICCTSCSTEKPELLLPLLQVHLMPWTGGDRGGVRGRGARGGRRPGPPRAQPFPPRWEAGSRDTGGSWREPRLPASPPTPRAPCSSSAPSLLPLGCSREWAAYGSALVSLSASAPGGSSRGPGVGEKGPPRSAGCGDPEGRSGGVAQCAGEDLPHLTSRLQGAEGTGPQGPCGLGSAHR